MDTKIMKKMIVLKNLQSNMIEEAYVVLKNNCKVHKFQKINEEENGLADHNEKENDYMVKEAEMVINDYICKMESKEFNFNNISLRKRNNIFKITTISFALLSLLNFIMFLFK